MLNTKELSVINEVIDKLSDMSAKEISEYSHGDMPWRIAEDNEDLDYEYVFCRDPEYTVREYDNWIHHQNLSKICILNYLTISLEFNSKIVIQQLSDTQIIYNT